MMIPRVLFLNVSLEANIPPNIKEDVASKPNRNAYNIVVKRASGATSPKRFVFGTGGRIRQSTRKIDFSELDDKEVFERGE
jgi:hypothetical protein